MAKGLAKASRDGAARAKALSERAKLRKGKWARLRGFAANTIRGCIAPRSRCRTLWRQNAGTVMIAFIFGGRRPHAASFPTIAR
nr:MAG: hypothetical protein DIU57_15380 [Pseudomonadota bacterium]